MVSVPQVLVVEPLTQTPCRQDRFVKASASPQVGVRLVKFLDSCKIITNDNWTLKIIQEGVQKLAGRQRNKNYNYSGFDEEPFIS